MKNLNVLFYLLFVLMVFGAFASMAQNDYGITILGMVAMSFALLFGIQLILLLFSKERATDKTNFLELVSLFVLSSILAMRVFYLRFAGVEILFGVGGLLLVVVYSTKLIRSFTLLKARSSIMAMLILIFHASITLYVFSMISVAFIPVVSEPSGAAAFTLLVAFLVMGYLKKEVMVGGEKISAFTYVARFKDHSVMLITLFFLFTGYMGLTRVGAIPKMYSDEFPQAYFELVSQAEAGKEEPADGKFKHEKFKEMYDRLVERHVAAENE